MKNKIKAIIAVSICAVVASSVVMAVSATTNSPFNQKEGFYYYDDPSEHTDIYGNHYIGYEVSNIRNKDGKVVGYSIDYIPESSPTAEELASKEAKEAEMLREKMEAVSGKGTYSVNRSETTVSDEALDKELEAFNESEKELDKNDEQAIAVLKQKCRSVDNDFCVKSLDDEYYIMDIMCNEIKNNNTSSVYSSDEVNLLSQYLTRRYYYITDNNGLKNEIASTINIPYVD
ncbi:MAG: hypothetical protein ACI4GV_07815 [Acutalibacteraceae bacterium]